SSTLPSCRLRCESELTGALPHHLEHIFDALGIEAYAPDYQFLGFEVRVRADRHVRRTLLELAHQRIEPRLHGKGEADLAHGGGRAASQELWLELLGEDALHLHRHAGQDEDSLAARLVNSARSHAAPVLGDGCGRG